MNGGVFIGTRDVAPIIGIKFAPATKNQPLPPTFAVATRSCGPPDPGITSPRTAVLQPMRPLKLTLYIRTYCHLCDDMRAAVEPWRVRLSLELEEVDVDDDPALEARLGEKVPVLMGGDEEICHYFFDEEAFKRCLEVGA